jgi:hypothetical protein
MCVCVYLSPRMETRGIAPACAIPTQELQAFHVWCTHCAVSLMKPAADVCMCVYV